jgi:DNA-binding beta-propeller fold protein YncE/4-amino-4-deoxy-L-arabinose transferase-like glycosyltransferase
LSTLPANTQNSTAQLETSSGLRPRRTLNRLAIAILALGLAGIGQYFFNHSQLWDGLLFYFAAAILFVWAVAARLTGETQSSFNKLQNNPPAVITIGWRRNVGVWLMVVGAGLSGIGYSFFGREDAIMQAWQLYVTSIALFIMGGILLTPGLPLRAELRHLFPDRKIVIGFAIVLALAVFMRLHNFTEQPFGIWFDEAEAGLEARRILELDEYRPVFFTPINVTGHLLWLYAQALTIFGDNIHGMRLVSVIFGLGGVVAAFLFGRELRGPRFGLALAFFVVVSRWHINFSRIAMTGVDAPFFEFLSLYFLTRFLKRGSTRDGLWAGITLGTGLLFYTAFRLYLVAIAIFLIFSLMRWGLPMLTRLRSGEWRRWSVSLLLLIISGWLVVAPVVRYALDNPDAFWYRTRQISVLTKRDQPDLAKALWASTQKHAMMFHIFGDRNGRHNLPGTPMLDPLMGMLMILGIALAIALNRYPANGFFLILLPVALLGGILTVDFEAPQSLRSIAVLPAVFYFCALAVAAVGKEAEQTLSSLHTGWIAVPATLVAGFMIFSNGYTYFVKQANDFASWNAFSAPETITGQKMAELGKDTVFYLSPFLTNHPTTHFLAPEIRNQRPLTFPDALPVRDETGRPAALFLHPDEAWVFDEAHRLYPNAQFEILSGPGAEGRLDGPPSVYFISLDIEDLLEVRGLELSYVPHEPDDSAETGILAPLQTDRVYEINTTWAQEDLSDGGFQAFWNGILYAPWYGTYHFRLLSPAVSSLEVNGNLISEGTGQQVVSVTLPQGNHRFRVEAEGAPGQVALYWQPPGGIEELVPHWTLYSYPVSNHGLEGTFYPNDNWEGSPVFQRIDPFLDTYFHLIPMQRPYSVEWEGSLVAPQSGVYRLGLRAVQEAELYLDGRLLLKTAMPNRLAETSVTLEAGLHELLVRYRDTVDRSRIHLSWAPPGGQFSPVPKEYLWPPMGDYPTVAPATAMLETQPAQQINLSHLLTLGMNGSEAGQFNEPRDVVVLSDDRIVVADTGNRRVQFFDPQYAYLSEITDEGVTFEEPLAVDAIRYQERDELLVLDSTQQWVYRFDESGQYLDRFGGPDARLFHPRGLTVFDDNMVGIADTGTGRLALFNSDGDQVGVIGSRPGSAPGQLNEPTDAIRSLDDNYYYVAEAENNRIQVLDSGGRHISQWNISPGYAYNGPHLAAVPDGTIFVTDSERAAIVRYATDGTLIEQWQFIGPVSLVQPVGIFFDDEQDRLYVTDVGTHQVHIFQAELISEE